LPCYYSVTLLDLAIFHCFNMQIAETKDFIQHRSERYGINFTAHMKENQYDIL
jgi:hypothetical protein